MPAGTYSVLIRGSINLPAWPGSITSLGKIARLTVAIDPINVNYFGLFSSTEIDSFNGLQPLVPGTVYNSSQNFFDCRTTVLPAADSCSGADDRAMVQDYPNSA